MDLRSVDVIRRGSIMHILRFAPRLAFLLLAAAVLTGNGAPRLHADQQTTASPPPTPYTQAFVRDPKVPIDEEYTRKIREYTTAPYFTSPLVDYLPASKTVPTPKAVLGDVAGAPGKLPY